MVDSLRLESFVEMRPDSTFEPPKSLVVLIDRAALAVEAAEWSPDEVSRYAKAVVDETVWGAVRTLETHSALLGDLLSKPGTTLVLFKIETPNTLSPNTPGTKHTLIVTRSDSGLSAVLSATKIQDGTFQIVYPLRGNDEERARDALYTGLAAVCYELSAPIVEKGGRETVSRLPELLENTVGNQAIVRATTGYARNILGRKYKKIIRRLFES